MEEVRKKVRENALFIMHLNFFLRRNANKDKRYAFFLFILAHLIAHDSGLGMEPVLGVSPPAGGTARMIPSS